MEHTKSPIFYGRRLGRRLRVSKHDALTAGLAQYGIDQNAVRAALDGSLRVDGFFNTDHCSPSPFTVHCLEIGFGGGEHPHGLAQQQPDWCIIGAEAFTNGVASLCEKLAAEPLSNIKIFPDDVRFLLPKLADQSLDRVYLLYPDPWPKSRHAKRRFFGPENIPVIARLLKPGGLWIIASDHPVYQQWVRDEFLRQDYFTAMGEVMGQTPPSGWISTRYEQKAIAAGRIGRYAILQRKNSALP